MTRAADREAEAFMKSWWRVLMALQYLIVCLFDFIIFPGLRELSYSNGAAFHEWRSLTLQGGGLYHAAMGAIVTATVWGKSQEFLARMKTGTTVERVTERSSISTTDPAADPKKDQPDDPPAGKSSRAD